MRLGYARVSTDDQNLDHQRLRLREAGCERLFEEIILAWTELLDTRANRQTATVTTATAPDPETVARVQSALEKATGKTIVLEKRVDPKLLGGLVIRTGDTVIDGSLRSRLVELRRRLRTAGRAGW